MGRGGCQNLTPTSPQPTNGSECLRGAEAEGWARCSGHAHWANDRSDGFDRTFQLIDGSHDRSIDNRLRRFGNSPWPDRSPERITGRSSMTDVARSRFDRTLDRTTGSRDGRNRCRHRANCRPIDSSRPATDSSAPAIESIAAAVASIQPPLIQRDPGFNRWDQPVVRSDSSSV